MSGLYETALVEALKLQRENPAQFTEEANEMRDRLDANWHKHAVEVAGHPITANMIGKGSSRALVAALGASVEEFKARDEVVMVCTYCAVGAVAAKTLENKTEEILRNL